MAPTIGAVERSVLKALSKSKQATVAEVAAMIPGEGVVDVDRAKAALVDQHLVEAVPGASPAAMRLTAEGARVAAETPDVEPAGSGGGESAFS